MNVWVHIAGVIIVLTTVMVYVTAVGYAVAIGLWIPPSLVYVAAGCLWCAVVVGWQPA